MITKAIKKIGFNYLVLHDFVEQSSKYIVLSLLLLSFTSLSGCSLTQEKPVAKQAQIVETAKNSDPEHSEKTESDESESLLHLTPQQMFEVMAAEMLLKRKQPKGAFNTIFPLARELRDPELAKRAFEISMNTYDLRNIEKAVNLWKDVSPEEDRVWRASYVLSLRKGDVDLAVEQWNKYQQLSVANLQSDLVASASRVASAASETHGIKFFQKLTEQFPEEWSSFYALGMVSTIYENPVVGIPALNQAKQMMQQIDSEDNLTLIYNLLSKLYLSVEPATLGIEALTPYVEKTPEDLLVQERLARLEVQAQKYKEAEDRYKFIVEKEPKAYTSLFSLALLQMERNDLDSAEQNLIKVSQEKGYQSVAFYYLGLLYQEQENNERAKHYFELVESAAYLVDAQLHLAEILFSEGKKAESYNILDNLDISETRNKVKQLRARAIFAASDGLNSEAIDFYNQALEIQPNNTSILKAQSLLFYHTEDFSSYESVLLRILKIDSQDSQALNALGYFYVEKNVNLDIAFSLLSRALALEPESFFILDSMGWYYYRIGDYDQALDYLSQSFYKVEDEEVLIHLITVYWVKGERDKAIELWQNYRAKFASNEQLQNIINQLESEAN